MMTLFEALIKIRDEGPVFDKYGICETLNRWGMDEWDFRNLAEKWPSFSGNYVFPVPDPDHNSCSVVYTQAMRNGYMWNPDHPYGALRLELLNWCIEQLENKTDD